jgi:gliding motility-associated-like protein
VKLKIFLLFGFFLFIGDFVSAQGPNPQVGMRVSGNKNPNTLCEGDTLYLMNLTQDSSKTVKYYVFNWNWKNEPFYPLYKDTIYNKDSVYHIYTFHDSVVYNNCKDRSKKLYVSLTAVDTFNDEFEIVSNIVLFLQPRVKFSGPTDACVNEEVTFTSNTCPIDTGFLFKWEVDGKTFTTEQIKYKFKTPGTYKIKLTVTATNPCSKSDSSVRYITIVDYPIPALSLYTLKKGNTICFGKDTLTVVNLSTNYTSATWLFNPYDTLKFKLVKNSNLGSDTVFFVPLSIDSFTVQLRVCNYQCCDTTSKYKFKSIISPEVKIKVASQCVRDSGIVLYNLLDTSAGFPDAFQWFLTGNGYADSGYSLPKSFKKLNYGPYTFKFNSNGVCDTFSHQTTFFISPKITRLLDTLKICNSVDLDYPLSSFFKNIPTNFGAKWTPDSLLNNYTFNALNRNAGTYKIKLIDTLSNCYNDSVIFIVFKSSPQRFNDTGFCLLTDSILFKSIEKGAFIGPGVTNNTFYPSAVGIGIYSIIFKSDTTIECPYSDTFLVTVHDTLRANFSYSKEGCKGVPFVFKNLSNSQVNFWDLGDNTKSYDSVVSKSYAAVGVYKVKLVIGVNGACRDSIEKNITVFESPTLTYSIVVDSSRCDSIYTTYAILNSDSNHTYKWVINKDSFSTTSLVYTTARDNDTASYLPYYVLSTNRCGAIADSGKVRIPPKFHGTVSLTGPSKKCTPFNATLQYSIYGQADSFIVNYGNGQTSKNVLNNMTYFNSGVTDTQYTVRIIAYDNKCGNVFDSITITVAPNNIKPGFTVNNPGCKNTDFNFINTSPDSIQIWNFGDTKSSSLQNPTHQYTTAGTFTVKATYIAPFGCTDTLEKQIIVFDKPIINHKYVIDSTDCDSVKITLMITNPDTAQNYTWRIGTDTFYNDTIDYKVSRLAKIDSLLNYRLSSYNICGAIADSGKIRIPPKFNSSITLIGPNKLCTPFNAFFKYSIYGQVDSFIVDYGNGQMSKNAINNMTYYNAGIIDTQFTISIAAFNKNCGVALDSLTLTVAPNNIKPAFTVNNPGCKNTDFNFVNTSPDSIQIWNFGDTKTSTLQDPTHQYTTAGTFKVQAKYIALFGCTDTLERQITVFDKPLMNHKYVIDSTDCDSIKIMLMVTNPDTAQNYTWRVGLDSFYNDTINYTVARLAKTDSFLNYTISSFSICGAIADSGKIRIPPKFNSNLKLNGASKKCTPFVATFSNSFYGQADSFFVDYGNGQSSKNILKSMTYYNSGTVDSQYIVKLIAYNGKCISALDSVIITVAPNNIKPTFSVNNAGCKNVDLSFNNTSSDSILMWYFGDGDSSKLQSPTHKYTQIGNYTVSAIYTANWGCLDTSNKKVRVIEPPKSTVTYTLDSSKCDTLLVNIKIQNPDTLNTYSWYLDSTFISNKTNETFTIVRRFSEFYQPYKLTTTNICGTIDNIDSIKVTVGFRAKVAINGKNTGCSPFIPTIDNFSTGKVSYFWVDYGNGDTSINRIKSTTYYNALPSTKKYPVVITAFNQLCDSLKDTTYVYVQPIKVKPYAQYSKTDYCVNEQVTFINNSSPEAAVRLFWGDGITVDKIRFGDTLRHVYAKPGNYFVSVEAESCGVDTSVVYPIVIEDFPKASFISEPTILCINQEVKFKKLGDSAFVRNWRIQSKDTAYRQDSFSKFFTQTGMYDVELIVESPLGKCRDSITRKFTLNPQATLSMNPSSQINCSPHVVCVSVKGNIDKYFIDWGNGLVGNNKDTCTVYNNTDTAKVRVFGSTPFGCSIVDSFYVQTYPPVATTNYTITVDSSACDFVKVICKVINPKPLINYKWYYNSTSYDTSNTEVIILKGQNIGSFPISLNASNYCGSITYFDTIPIGLKWMARLGVSGKNIGCTPFTASFINHSYGQVDSFVVNYGDNTSSKNTILTKTYINNDDTVRTFRVVLTQFNNQCLPSSDTVFIQVYPNNIKLAVEYNQTSYCKNEEVKFINRSLDKAGLIFYFGDGTSLSGNFNYGDTIKHNYFAPGQYKISVKTLLPCNGDSVNLYTVVINDIPALDFDSDRSPICSATDMIFKTVSTDVSNLVWTIDNADTIKNSNQIKYNFQTSGLHSVSLSAISSTNDCSNTITKNYTVYPFTDYRFWIDTPICEGQVVCAHLRGDIEKMTINWGNNNFGNITDTCTKYSKSGSYTVNVNTTSYLGCYDQTKWDLYVHPPPKVEILPDRAFLDLAIGSSLTLSFDSNQNYRKFYWLSNNDTLCNNLDPNCRQLNVGPFERTTEESFKLILQDEFGCFGQDQILIKNSSEAPFYVPNAFSPNKDGINETFRPIILDYKIEAYDMYVFNRWGEILYKSINSPIDAMGWDGYYLDKKCESELYNVLIKFKTNQGIDQLTYKGYIMLVD